jgi:arginyl-tRNA synthetase
MTIQTQLHDLTIKAVKELGVTDTQLPQLHFEHPADSQHGDFSTNVAMVLFSQFQKTSTDSPDKNSYKNPRELAEKFIEAFHRVSGEQDQLFSNITVAGPGFINFTLSEKYLFSQLKDITQNSEKMINNSGKGRQIVVEYSSPNIAKPFTIGHLRSTIIGDAVANLMEATGWIVIRDNHWGDWGTQFGKQIYALKAWGSEEEIENSERPVKKLVELYVKFHEEAEKNPSIEEDGRAWFKKLEEGDQEARRLWKKCLDWSMKEFNAIYQKLGISFTANDGKGYGESFFEDKMRNAIQELEEKGLLKESEGAKLVFFPDDVLPPLMILKKDGATLYATRDLATDKFRLQHYGPDIVVANEVGAEQSLYWQQIFKLEQMLGWYQEGQRVHIKHGHYRFKDQKMSTRKGNVIWLEDVLLEAEKRAGSLSADRNTGAAATENSSSNAVAEIVGIGALKWNDLKRSSHLDVTFDWDEVLSMDGNSGPYMQYAYARAKSVLRKAGEKDANLESIDWSTVKLESEELTILRLLDQLDEAVQKAAAEYSPHHLSTYLFELAQAFNRFYNTHSILGDQSTAPLTAQSLFRVELTKAVAIVLEKGLQLLGIKTVEKM